MNHTWDFGDGVGNSTQSDPTYLFPSPGTFTVTLNVENSAGSSQVQDPVTITNSQCITLTQLALVPPIVSYAGKSTALQLDISPDTATKPYHYKLEFNDGSDPISSTSSYDPLQVLHTFPVTGTFPITGTAWNCDMQPIMITTQVTVTESPPQAYYFPIYLFSGSQPVQ